MYYFIYLAYFLPHFPKAQICKQINDEVQHTFGYSGSLPQVSQLSRHIYFCFDTICSHVRAG